VFGLSENGLSGVTENLYNPAAFALLDEIVEILKKPVQSPRQHSPYTGLPGTHKANQKNGMGQINRARSPALADFSRADGTTLRQSLLRALLR
jgi:hypothetical protein